MKILIVADHKDPLVYSPNVKKRFGDVALVLGAGDLPLEYYGFIVSSLNKPLYFVFGNHNLKRYKIFKYRESTPCYPETPAFMAPVSLYENSFGSTYIGDKVLFLKKQNLIIAGLGGSYRYNKGLNQYTELQMFLKILRLIPGLLWNKIRHGRYVDILLTHAPPRGIHDREDPCHRGFKSFLWFIDRFSPRYLLHGHVHLYSLNEKRQSLYKKTIIINTYDHFLLNYEENHG